MFPMGFDLARFFAKLFLYYYENKGIKKVKKNDIRQARRFPKYINLLKNIWFALTTLQHPMMVESLSRVLKRYILLNKKSCQKNYITSLCGKLFYIFSNIYFGKKCLKKKKKKKKMKPKKIAKRAVSNPYVLNCFKYFLIYILKQNVSKELYQVVMW